MEEAIAVFEAGLAIDVLAEPLYRGLMRCYQVLGRQAERVAVYGRCRKLVISGLGRNPSAETEALHQAPPEN